MHTDDIQPGDQFVDDHFKMVQYTVLEVEPAAHLGTGIVIPVWVQFNDGGCDFRYFAEGSDVPLTRPAGA